MKFNYVSKEITITPAMKKQAEEKLSKFDKYFTSKGEVLTTITVTQLPNRVHAVEVSMVSKGCALRAKVSTEEFYVAIDMLIAKLEGQLRKVKAQSKKNKKSNSLKAFKDINFTQIDDNDIKPAAEIVKRKKLSLAPMDVDEALCRMDALGHDFFIYLDSSTGLVNVLYGRDDETYGVIEIENH